MKNCVLVTEWAVNGGRQFKFARQGISGSLHEAALFTLGQESLPVFPQGCLETGQTQTDFWHVSSVGLTPLERSPFLRAGWLSQKMSQPEKVWDPKCFSRRITPVLKSEYWRACRIWAFLTKNREVLLLRAACFMSVNAWRPRERLGTSRVCTKAMSSFAFTSKLR